MRKRLRRRRGEKIKFKSRSLSKRGIFSMATGLTAIVIFIALSIYSAGLRGEADLRAGAGAMAGFIISIFGFIWAYKSFKERDIYYWPSIVGILSNGIMFLVYMILYAIGMA